MKVPESVLVVIYTPSLEVLLLERADHSGFWQSITGSRESAEEPLRTTCVREVAEETGLIASPDRLEDWHLSYRFRIYENWRHRYAAGVTHNTEHVFALCIENTFEPRLDPREHLACQWLGWREAADACFSSTNAEAIRRLQRLASNLQNAVGG